MLDWLHERNQEIQQAVLSLECKVHSSYCQFERENRRTQELHIQLLNQARDKLLVVNEKLAALGELTAAAHEINNPTAVILGNVELTV
ncbi:hypothetical protein O9992_18995 [Vibrio lentus]|nr:hypothetical protein [Vibrio lentus]